MGRVGRVPINGITETRALNHGSPASGALLQREEEARMKVEAHSDPLPGAAALLVSGLYAVDWGYLSHNCADAASLSIRRFHGILGRASVWPQM